VIHIAERDTQVSDRPKLPGEFVNTWSVDGFYEEGVAPAEKGWGTHERALPALAHTHEGEGPATRSASPRWRTRPWFGPVFPQVKSLEWSSATAKHSRSAIISSCGRGEFPSTANGSLRLLPERRGVGQLC
jgi:homospermidine synthase